MLVVQRLLDSLENKTESVHRHRDSGVRGRTRGSLGKVTWAFEESCEIGRSWERKLSRFMATLIRTSLDGGTRLFGALKFRMRRGGENLQGVESRYPTRLSR